jgi:hypothetical protein
MNLLEALPNKCASKELQMWLQAAVTPRFLGISQQKWEEGMTGMICYHKIASCFNAWKAGTTGIDV